MWNSIILFLQLTSHSLKNIHFTHKDKISYLGVNVKKAKTWKADTLKTSRFCQFK